MMGRAAKERQGGGPGRGGQRGERYAEMMGMGSLAVLRGV